MFSKLQMLSTTASSSRTIDGLDGDTAVQRRCFAPDARSADGASPRGQTTVDWAERPREAHSARTSPWIRARRLQWQQSVTLRNTKYLDRLMLAHSARLFAARPRGSQRWLGRLGPTRSAAHPARLFAAPDHNYSRWFRRLLESLHAQ